MLIYLNNCVAMWVTLEILDLILRAAAYSEIPKTYGPWARFSLEPFHLTDWATRGLGNLGALSGLSHNPGARERGPWQQGDERAVCYGPLQLVCLCHYMATCCTAVTPSDWIWPMRSPAGLHLAGAQGWVGPRIKPFFIACLPDTQIPWCGIY